MQDDLWIPSRSSRGRLRWNLLMLWLYVVVVFWGWTSFETVYGINGSSNSGSSNNRSHASRRPTSTRKSAAKSYYDILGVPKTATDKEIKKAYRKLAIQHHPDKGGEEETFKEISKAYQTLSNPDEKKIYDQFGEAGLEMGAGPNAGSYGFPGPEGNPFGSTGFNSYSAGSGPNPFQHFFSSQGTGGTAAGGQSFYSESFAFGKDGNIDLSELLRGMMGGNPMEGSFGSSPFRPQSSSQYPQSYTRPIRCTLEDLAKGTTKKMKITFQGKEQVYIVHIKPGWKAGTKITFQGSNNGIPTMIFQVEEIPHKFLRREGNDLYFVCWIDEHQTKGGIQVNIPLPTGEMYHRKIPRTAAKDNMTEYNDATKVLSNGEKLVIPNKGMPIKGGPQRGNLVIEFRVRRPSSTFQASKR